MVFRDRIARLSTGKAAGIRGLRRPKAFCTRATLIVFLVLASICGVFFGLHARRYRDEFIFVTVEESSSSALAALPIGWERLPNAFIDCENRSIELEKRPLLLGVSLGVHCVSSSQGIEFQEYTRFSITGKHSVLLSEPASAQGRDWSGNTVEMVDNAARIVRGDLIIEGLEPSGVVRFRYGRERFSLAPGESWAELLAFADGSIKEIGAESWERDMNESLASGFPVTRLAVANRGFWPKSGVRGFFDEGEGGK